MTGLRRLLAVLLMALAALSASPALAQSQLGGPNDIAVELFADRQQAGEGGTTKMTVALHFTPRAPEWHGYWSNPGDAGLGMQVDWSWPDEWFGAALYPLPSRLVIGDLMNHIYEGEYAVLYEVAIPAGIDVSALEPLSAKVDYLACTDTICVPQTADVTLNPGRITPARIDDWRADIVPPLGSAAGFEFAGDRLRIGIPLPAASALGDAHVFVETDEIGAGRAVAYTGVQTFIREGDLLVAEIPLRSLPGTNAGSAESAARIEGILDLGTGRGVRFAAQAADVPLEGVKPIRGAATPTLWQLLLAALAGGLLLNIMPCVFPILSLKALALAKAGGAERAARTDALAYTAGVMMACGALGLTILALRSAGEQIGWAFQLQEPVVVVALLFLALAITANFLGLFEVPGLAVSGRGPSRGGSFATGLLAAFVATPCTGPFMALALGAALVIPPLDGLLVFLALGLGLALPFLLIGFVPGLRRRLPQPGPWMERFRRWMALPMGLTALALAWLVWRLGGWEFLALVSVLALLCLAGLALVGLFQRRGRAGPGLVALSLLAVLSLGFALLPTPQSQARASESILDPVPFSDAELASARATGQPVFVWFTADWCVTCKVNESVAIERESTRAAFEEAGVIAMRADWTRRDEEISRMLTRQGAAGVPLYLWYAPGSDAEQLPQVLTPDLLEARARASQ
ncbi:thioredoxin family protein [Qipengyuania sp. XHP0207]|uniref:protein-disulfide reductase DsbD family protein n=1 Tax=Qipengyuania sp. XHP0207 TaxID=3038078 RepID=UPI00241D250F|nr:protein-disulfide reductase DsbD [Qipengyuania sp. XHP0207]MDG5746976.1 thioredoxin family protein [Qipengyuania sp. XHP0207]